MPAQSLPGETFGSAKQASAFGELLRMRPLAVGEGSDN